MLTMVSSYKSKKTLIALTGIRGHTFWGYKEKMNDYKVMVIR